MKMKNGLTKNYIDALLLKLVHDHFEEERSLQHPDAPGHAHRVRGRWDKDGSVCEWCQTWDLVRECVKQSEKQQRTNNILSSIFAMFKPLSTAERRQAGIISASEYQKQKRAEKWTLKNLYK
jgi:hypothetical protein